MRALAHVLFAQAQRGVKLGVRVHQSGASLMITGGDSIPYVYCPFSSGVASLKTITFGFLAENRDDETSTAGFQGAWPPLIDSQDD